MKAFITGGAGFIGSNLVEELLKRGCFVTAYDNLSLGKKEFLRCYFKNKNFKFIKGDILDLNKLKKAMLGHRVIFHLAANSDIDCGRKYTDTDLRQGILGTYNVLEAMRINKIKEIIFTSSSVIFGDVPKVPVTENHGPSFPISLYGASKLSAEGLISAYVHNFDMRGWIFRLGNVVGRNSTHGVLVDFIKKLRKNPKELEVLGNGKQAKSYIYVRDCIEGMLFGYEYAKDKLNCFNLSSPGTVDVNTVAGILIKEMGLKNVRNKYTGKDRGWPGDVTYVKLNVNKIGRLGWKVKLSSDQAIKFAIRDLLRK
ncbi:MAG: NAD-dependent epimerase/dehydratase family protein [Candidatus Omnitrophota bacterium]|nr:NAD-dependent epimerase/dehydratase family protein [Candidatus Omnitrophota bacterium]